MNHPDTKDWMSHCESEPLAFSGAIQPHGGMIYLDLKKMVTHASENLETFLPYAPTALLGRQLPLELEEILSNGIDELADASGSRVELLGVDIAARPGMDFVLIRSGSGIVVELSLHQHRLPKTRNGNVPMKTPANHAQATKLHGSIAALVREMIGFDRVMIYAFREDGDGEVVAESRDAEVYGSYLGLRFPASDIPNIARELYKVNPWRFIPDSQAAPVTLLSCRNEPPNLTWSDLRSVSPVHQRYLSNMAVRGSLSLPVMVAGELWGLIACHHSDSLTLPLKKLRDVREVSKHYGLVISTWIAETRMRFIDRLDTVYTGLLATLLENGDLVSAMPEITPVLMDLFQAQGMAIRIGDVWVHTGNSPKTYELEKLAAHIDANIPDPLFSTDSISRSIPETQELTVAGLLTIRFTGRSQTTQIWLFRTELVHDVAWGGNPSKPVEFSERGIQIAPRKSFDSWVEQRKGYSRAWNAESRLAAKRLRQLLLKHDH